MTGAGQIRRGGSGVDGSTNGMRPVSGGYPSGYALASFNGLSECGSKARRVLLRHWKQSQVVGPLFGQGQADEAAAVAGHEVDGLRRNVLSGQREIAFVFAIFVVDYDNHAAGANLSQCARSEEHTSEL